MVTHGGSVRPNSISIFSAVRTLFAHFKEIAGDSYVEQNEQDALNALRSGEEAPPSHKLVLSQRACHLILRALLSGDLCAHFSDGLESCDVPGWAWETEGRTVFAWGEGRLPLDVFLPEEWQRWSCHEVFLEEDAFTQWAGKQTLHDPVGLPDLPPPYDAETKPAAMKKRLPPDTPFVTLSEALTWIAFGFAMGRDSLDRAISGHAFDATDPEAALANAMAKFAVRASGGQIAVRGKYVESHSTDATKVDTKLIDPVRFEDFAQFDTLYDGLRYGTGLTWEKRNNTLDSVLQDRRDAFRSVKVNRADLLKQFPPKTSFEAIVPMAVPNSLMDVGPVMGLGEAISLIAEDYSTQTAEKEEFADGAEDRLLAARKVILNALVGGELKGLFSQENKRSFTIAQTYWQGMAPERLEMIYYSAQAGKDGDEYPVLLARQAFDAWRLSLGGESAQTEPTRASISDIGPTRAPSVKAGRPPTDEEILAKADEMKARGLDGRTLAKTMRLEPGFENVATTAVRELIKGRWRPTGRRKKAA